MVAHLGSQAEIFDAGITAALDGTDPPGREFMQPIWDTWNARSPDDAVAESLRVNEQLVQRLEGLTDEQLASMYLSMFGMELDAAGLVRLRLSELTLHTWDVAVALDPAATLPSDAVALLIDTLGPLAARTGKPQATAFRLQIHTVSPERQFLLKVGDAVELTGCDGGTADGELRIPSEALVRLVYGRLDRDHTPGA